MNPSRRRVYDAVCVALFVAAALWLTRPWILHPLSTSIGAVDPLSGLESIDGVSNMTFGGWWKFSLLKLRAWPLSHTRYLMYPFGATPGLSFDSLLSAISMGALSLALPLHLAYNLVILSSFILTGFFAFRFSVRRWGRGWIALVIGLSAEFIPYLFHRAGGHTNLLPIWPLWVLMHLMENLREKPTPKRAAAFGAAFPLLAASSWYILIMGFVYAACATAAMAIAAALRRSGCKSKTLAHLAMGWAMGLAGVFVLASPMLAGMEGRERPTANGLAIYSTPLIQYALPFPGSFFASRPSAIQTQTKVNTNWEALAALPAGSLLVFLAALFVKRGLSLRLGLFAAFVLAAGYSLGPFLQISHALEPGKGETTPLYHLMKFYSGFGMFRAPGRMHVLAYFAALAASGFALEAVRSKLFARPAPGARFIWPGLCLLVLAANLLWTAPTVPMPVFSNLRVPEFYRSLAGKRGGAIFDVPFDYFGYPYYNYYQFFHERPAVSSTLYHDAHQGKTLDFFRSLPELLFFSANNGGSIDDATVARAAAPEFMDYLSRYGIEYVVVHDRNLNHAILHGYSPASTRDKYAQIEAGWKPRLVYSDDFIRVYRTRLADAPQP